MIKRLVLGQLRHALGAGGAGLSVWLIENGATAQDAEVIISGIIALVGFAWSAFEKWKDDKNAKK